MPQPALTGVERCEVCGKPIYGRPHLVVIEGVVMRVCDECARLGKPYSPPPRRTGAQQRAPRLTEEDLEDLVLAPNYNRLIKEARERMGLTQEELAAKVGVKASVISKVESGKLRPDVPTARRLESVLKVKILTRVDELEI